MTRSLPKELAQALQPMDYAKLDELLSSLN